MTDKKDTQGHSKRSGAICSSGDLTFGGVGVRFEVTDDRGNWPGFVVRHSQGPAAYINRCAHLGLELDWDPGHFFDVDQRHLVCATHGAFYAADTGECIGGPCDGLGLEALQVIETDGTVYLSDPRYVVDRWYGKSRS